MSTPLNSFRFALITALFALAAYPAWIRGGTPRDLQLPLVLLGLIILVIVLCISVFRLLPSSAPSLRFRWIRDPVFYAGLLFLVLLGVQWYYAGRVQFFDPIAQTWTYTPPLRPGWPSSFTGAESAEMLCWFFPAWAAVLSVRSGVLGSTGLLTLWRLLALNAAAVGVLGIVQQQLARPLFPYTAELTDLRFFASFGYENHAASFFVLMAALSAGLALRELMGSSELGARSAEPEGLRDQGTKGQRDRGGEREARSTERGAWRRARAEFRARSAKSRRRAAGRAAVMLGALMVNLAAAYFSLSRAGILLASVLVVVGVTWGLIRVWRGMSPVGRVNAVAGGAAVLLALAMVIVAFGRQSIGSEIASLGALRGQVYGQSNDSLELDERILLDRAALDMFRAQPAFGVGGWGFRYLLPYTQPDDSWASSGVLGKANVHNDPLQFLAEFGAIGAGLLALSVIVMLVPIFRRDRTGRRPAWSNAAVFFAIAGTSLVWVHSLIDLPFRCPAVLLAWVMVLSGAGEICRRARSPERKCRMSNFEC